jgi:hypothetical protein
VACAVPCLPPASRGAAGQPATFLAGARALCRRLPAGAPFGLLLTLPPPSAAPFWPPRIDSGSFDPPEAVQISEQLAGLTQLRHLDLASCLLPLPPGYTDLVRLTYLRLPAFVFPDEAVAQGIGRLKELQVRPKFAGAWCTHGPCALYLAPSLPPE